MQVIQVIMLVIDRVCNIVKAGELLQYSEARLVCVTCFHCAFHREATFRIFLFEKTHLRI